MSYSFRVGDCVRCIDRSWQEAFGHSAVVISSSEDGSFRLGWEDERLNAYPWLDFDLEHIRFFKLLSCDPQEQARLLDKQRREEHAMRYL